MGIFTNTQLPVNRLSCNQSVIRTNYPFVHQTSTKVIVLAAADLSKT